MTDAEQNRIYDAVYEMKGLAATLLAASHGDLLHPEKVVEYAAAQLDRLAADLASAISESSDNSI